jgi:hypothetical protein
MKRAVPKASKSMTLSLTAPLTALPIALLVPQFGISKLRELRSY